MARYVKKNTPVGRPAKWPTGTQTQIYTRRIPVWMVGPLDAFIRQHQTGPGALKSRPARIFKPKKTL